MRSAIAITSDGAPLTRPAISSATAMATSAARAPATNAARSAPRGVEVGRAAARPGSVWVLMVVMEASLCDVLTTAQAPMMTRCRQVSIRGGRPKG